MLSVIQYFYCFYVDVVTSSEKFNKSKYFTLRTSPIGIFRLFFDILLPLVSVVFVLSTCHVEFICFSQKISRYAGERFITIGELNELGKLMLDYSELRSIEIGNIPITYDCLLLKPSGKSDPHRNIEN